VLLLVEQAELPFTRLDSTQGKGTKGASPAARFAMSGTNTVLLLAVPDERLSNFASASINSTLD
jgi:hypothetical protein